MKCSLGISNFLEKISRLSHFVVLLYFSALITEEGFLTSSCYSLELCIQMLISFLFSYAFHFSFFTAICKASSDFLSHFAFLHFFSMGMVLIPVSCTMSWTSVHSSSVQSLSRVQLFATPWIAAHQASMSITNSRSSLRLTSIESVMPSSHPILWRSLLLLPSIPPSIRVFSNESALPMKWPKY